MFDEELRACKICNEPKPASQYYRAPRRKDKLFPYCKLCSNEKAKNWRQANPDRARALRQRSDERHPDRWKAYRLRNYYGMERQSYEAKLSEQCGRCAVCEREISSVFVSKKRLRDTACVDHNHATGKVRSLVCQRCNYLIGCLESHGGLIEKAAAYLAKWRC